MRTAPTGGTAAAATVADVLMEFLESRRPRLGVTEISRSLGVSKAVVHRILQSLQDRGMVAFNERDRTYVLGPSLLALGATAFRSADLRVAALPTLSWLQMRTRQTATVSALTGTHRMFLDQVVSSEELRLSVETGRLLPLHVGASGRAILAFCPPQLQEQVLAAGLESHTANTMTDYGQLRRALDRIARDHVAVSHGERTHVSGSVAAPVLGPDGLAVGAIAVCGPVQVFTTDTVDELIPLVQEGAAEVSERLAELMQSGEPDTR